MREIKFKLWDKRRGKWLSDYSISSYDKVLDLYEELDCKREDSILVQYTGLKDKNVKEIYEGDVLNNGHYKTQVYWNEHTGVWSHRSTNVDDALYIYIASNTTFAQELLFEIIGNIYENPELIK